MRQFNVGFESVLLDEVHIPEGETICINIGGLTLREAKENIYLESSLAQRKADVLLMKGQRDMLKMCCRRDDFIDRCMSTISTPTTAAEILGLDDDLVSEVPHRHQRHPRENCSDVRQDLGHGGQEETAG